MVEFTPGQLGMSGASAPAVTLSATADSLDNAFSIAFGPSGALWVANSGNNTVVEFTPAQLAATGAPTPAVTLSAVGTSLNFPDGLAFDSAGDLLVMDFPSNTVVEFTPAPTGRHRRPHAGRHPLGHCRHPGRPDRPGLRPLGRPVGGEH